jgi:hypothetical protein
MRRSASTAPECGGSLNALLLIGSIRWLDNRSIECCAPIVLTALNQPCPSSRLACALGAVPWNSDRRSWYCADLGMRKCNHGPRGLWRWNRRRGKALARSEPPQAVPTTPATRCCQSGRSHYPLGSCPRPCEKWQSGSGLLRSAPAAAPLWILG